MKTAATLFVATLFLLILGIGGCIDDREPACAGCPVCSSDLQPPK